MAKRTASSEPAAPNSKPADVDRFLHALRHPLVPAAQHAREIILAADRRVGEEIAWNAPSFFYTGPLAPFPPKEYRRAIVNFNFFRNDALRLIFLRGRVAEALSTRWRGRFADDRRMLVLGSDAEVADAAHELTGIVRAIVNDIATRDRQPQ